MLFYLEVLNYQFSFSWGGKYFSGIYISKKNLDILFFSKHFIGEKGGKITEKRIYWMLGRKEN